MWVSSTCSFARLPTTTWHVMHFRGVLNSVRVNMKYAMHVRLRLLSAYLAECRDVPKTESHRVPLGKKRTCELRDLTSATSLPATPPYRPLFGHSSEGGNQRSSGLSGAVPLWMTKGFIVSPVAEIDSRTEHQPVEPLASDKGAPVRRSNITSSFWLWLSW
jgi:hypothetical protein